MIRLDMENCNMILTEKHHKYQYYHQEKLAIYEYLTGKEYYPQIKAE